MAPSSSSSLLAAQARLAPLSRAFDALVAGEVGVDDVFSVEPLLWSWRQLRPRCHAGAGDDAVDVASLVDVLARRPELLDEARENGGALVLRPVDDEARHRPVRAQIARALADACVLGLEQQKLRHGLRADPEALKQFFATPDDAKAALIAVHDADVPAVEVGRVEVNVDVRVGSHVVVGAAARRLFDLLSPSVRRLRVDLALLGRDGALVDDDDVYRGLARLNEREPGCVAERRDFDGKDGVFNDDGCVFVIDCARLAEDAVDRRARSLVTPLKKQGAVIVGVTDAIALPAVLQAGLPRTVQVLATSTLTTAPRALVDGNGGVFVGGSHGGSFIGDDAGPAVLSAPSTSWLPLPGAAGEDGESVDGCCDAWWCLNVVARAAALDAAMPTPTAMLTTPRDESQTALRALATMTPTTRR